MKITFLKENLNIFMLFRFMMKFFKLYTNPDLSKKKQLLAKLSGVAFTLLFVLFITIFIFEATLGFMQDNSRDMISEVVDIAFDDPGKLLDDGALVEQIDAELVKMEDMVNGSVCENFDRFRFNESNSYLDSLLSAINQTCRNDGEADAALIAEKFILDQEGNLKGVVVARTVSKIDSVADKTQANIDSLKSMIGYPWILFFVTFLFLAIFIYISGWLASIDFIAWRFLNPLFLILVLPYFIFRFNIFGFLVDKVDLEQYNSVLEGFGAQVENDVVNQTIESLAQAFAGFYLPYFVVGMLLLVVGICFLLLNRLYLIRTFGDEDSFNETGQGQTEEDD